MLNFWTPDAERESWSTPGEEGAAHAEEFARALHDYNPRAELRFIKRGADWAPEDWRGRWAVVVKNGGGVPPSVFIVQTPAGEYSDPLPEHLGALMAKDAERNSRAWREQRSQHEKRERDRRIRGEEKHREFRETLLDRVNHLHDARIAVTEAMKERVTVGDVQDAPKVTSAIGVTTPMREA